ncbi:MAG: ferrous iron transport protein A [Pseudomonadota bacterium]|nr:ferrous iron transport protein A [Pseudomonadota bacterium]MDQ3229006.1 ferrous iron transport protein A [Pseudomonadota bacterium]
MLLSDLPHRVSATVETVEDRAPNDSIARRLRELGFVAGEPVQVMASGPVGAEPLLIQIGYTRFALRRSEAARVRVRTHDGTLNDSVASP